MTTRARMWRPARVTCLGLAMLAIAVASSAPAGILAAAAGEPAPATPPPPPPPPAAEQQPSAVPGVLTVGQEPGQAQITQLLILLAEQLDLASDRAEAAERAAATPPPEPGAVLRLATLTQDLTGRALPILIAVAPLVVAGAALAMQLGARRHAFPVMYAAIGSVVVVMLARGLAA